MVMSFRFLSVAKLFSVSLFSVVLFGCGGSGGKNTIEEDSNIQITIDDETGTEESTQERLVATNLETFFLEEIQPSLDYCRTCHQAGGIADTDEGRDFILSLEISEDYLHVQTSWEILGEGIEESEILTRNSSPDIAHTGGKVWPATSEIYEDVAMLLACWSESPDCFLPEDEEPDDPSDDPGEGEDDPNQYPLLGSSHGKHIWEAYCEEAADDAPLPVDPRTLVVPGANENKSVYFNAFYEDCHINMPEEEGPPKTCGEYKARVASGYWFANQRAPSSFTVFSSRLLNNVWKQWDLVERPDNFDALLTERYGMNPAPFHNPYPLPGEDPTTTEGGSGQLPMGLIQTKNKDGIYTGGLTFNCYICHGGQIGYEGEGKSLGSIPGMGNTNADFIILARDLTSGLAGTLPVSLGSVRGTSNAVGAFDMLAMMWDVDTLNLMPNPFKMPLEHPYHGNQDMPNWWNVSHRPRKFFDGGLSVDSTRIDMAAADQINMIGMSGKERRAISEKYDQDLQAYVDSQVAPPFPGIVDEQLAEQGAIVFHNKNLWAEQGNAHLEQPPGNGSCASCHGAYSPRFVNDGSFLETPELAGVAAHIVPLNLIGTDPNRALSLAPAVRKGFGSSWWGYPEGMPGYVAPKDKTFMEEYMDDVLDEESNPERMQRVGACGWEQEVVGYLAPPLFGVWASSPYFHNGVVPTIRQVLRSNERPAVWSRLDNPEENLPFRGYDMSLRAYDLEQNVGWKYEEFCSDDGSLPAADCNSESEWVNIPGILKWLDNLKREIWLFGFFSAPYATQEEIDARKIVNTHEFGNSNRGHEFSDVLTDQEVDAVIEYLKTL